MKNEIIALRNIAMDLQDEAPVSICNSSKLGKESSATI